MPPLAPKTTTLMPVWALQTWRAFCQRQKGDDQHHDDYNEWDRPLSRGRLNGGPAGNEPAVRWSHRQGDECQSGEYERPANDAAI